MTSRRGLKAAGTPPDELEELSDRNIFRYFKYEFEAIGHGAIVKQLQMSVRHRLRQLGLIEDVGGELRLTKLGLKILEELEAEA
jgi:hypothetical protein